MSETTGNALTVKNALTDPESIDWSHQTVKSTEQLFKGLVEAAKNGHWLEAINAYFAIAKSGNMDLFTGTRIVDIWRPEYMKGVPWDELEKIRKTYLHYFGDILKQANGPRQTLQ